MSIYKRRDEAAQTASSGEGLGAVNKDWNSTPLQGDNPISDDGDDVFKRVSVADAFAKQVLALDASEGTTVGVFGPWGSGKTSLVNLARQRFERARVPVLDFNPWLFSGAEQLVERFFAELSAELNLRDLRAVGKALEDYGGALSGKVGATVKVAGVRLRRREGGTSGRRKTVASTLRKRDKPIVAVLDDIDRLSAPEVREVFKLVRPDSQLPQYHLHRALRPTMCRRSAQRTRDYRDGTIWRKSSNGPFDLPEVPRHLLAGQLTEAIENALVGIESPGPFDKDAWEDIREDIVRPLIRNMRDVRRYAIAIRATVGGLEGQVARADVLALEAIRLFLPDVFRLLPAATDGLTGMTQAVDRRLDEMTLQSPDDPLSGLNKGLKDQVDGLITAAGKDRNPDAARTVGEVVEAMVSQLFPVGARLRMLSNGDSAPYVNDDAVKHLSERRVAHEHVLRLYLERVISEGLLVFHDAERALARMADHDGLNEFIRSLEPMRWQDVISHLGDLADRFRSKHVDVGIVVLLNLWEDMPERPPELAVFGGARGIILKVILRLLRVLKDATAVEAAVRRILPEVTSLSAKVELVLQIGHREKSSHKLVSVTTARELETMLRNEIRAATTDELALERDPSRILEFAKHHAGPSEKPFDMDDSPELTFALLRSVRGQMETLSVDSRVVHRIPVLNWERLIDLYGDTEVLETRIKEKAYPSASGHTRC